MIEKREVEIAKEIDDVGKFLVDLTADIRKKKPVDEIVGGSLANLVEAINKVDEVDDEFKANRKVALATIGSRTGELTDAIIN